MPAEPSETLAAESCLFGASVRGRITAENSAFGKLEPREPTVSGNAVFVVAVVPSAGSSALGPELVRRDATTFTTRPPLGARRPRP
jgi:hypothetical protein